MNDDDPNVPLPRRVAPPAGVDAAIAAGSRLRTRRRALHAGGAAAVVVLAGAVVLQLGGGVIALESGPPARAGEQSPSPSASPVAAPSPLASATAAATAPVVVPTAAPGGLLPSSAVVTSDPQPTDEASPTPRSRGREIGHGPDDPVDGAPALSRSTTTDSTACARMGQVGRAEGGWCAELTGPTQLRVGTDTEFTHRVCRSADSQAGTLTFRTRAEIGAGVQSDEDLLWAWGNGRAFATATTTLTVPAGDCVSWRFTWRGEDDDGFALPAGSYGLTAVSAAEEFGEDGDVVARPGTLLVDVRD